MLSLLASLLLAAGQVSPPGAPAAPAPAPAPAATPSAPQFQLELLDGRTLRGIPQSLEADRLTLATGSGTEAVALDDLVLLEAVPAPMADRAGPEPEVPSDRPPPPDLL